AAHPGRAARAPGSRPDPRRAAARTARAGAPPGRTGPDRRLDPGSGDGYDQMARGRRVVLRAATSMIKLPFTDPGQPDTRSPARFLLWIARHQWTTLLAGVTFGV